MKIIEIHQNERLDPFGVLEVVNKKSKRDEKIKETTEMHGYSQKEVADYLGLHYSTISRLVNEDNKNISK